MDSYKSFLESAHTNQSQTAMTDFRVIFISFLLLHGLFLFCLCIPGTGVGQLA